MHKDLFQREMPSSTIGSSTELKVKVITKIDQSQIESIWHLLCYSHDVKHKLNPGNYVGGLGQSTCL